MDDVGKSGIRCFRTQYRQAEASVEVQKKMELRNERRNLMNEKIKKFDAIKNSECDEVKKETLGEIIALIKDY